MRYLFPAVLTALVALTAAVSHAKAPLAAASKAKVVTIPNPCKQDFELHVSVTPTEGTDHWPIGFTMAFKQKSGRGIASRLVTEAKSEFNEAACQRWQARNWVLLDRILFENKRVDRAKVVCRNIAAISYRLGKKSEKSQVCLGSIKDDAVAYAFKNFFEASDGMVE